MVTRGNNRQRRDAPVLYRYAVRITIFDSAANVTDRDEKLFRLRKEAVDYAKKVRREHDVKKLISYVDVLKLSEGRVVENYKTKGFRKRERR